MIKSSTLFLYNNQLSTDFGVINASIQSGLYEESFIPSVELKEVVTKNNDLPYLQRVKKLPFEFKLTIAFSDYWDKNKLAALARLFTVDYYAPMVFNEQPDKIYFCIPNGDSIISHNGSIGYITQNFRCDSPYAYSPIFSTVVYDLTTNPTSTTIQLVNNGDISCFPVVYVQIISGSTFSIVNLSNAGLNMGFTGLNINENLQISGQDQEILTDQPLTYRYNNMTGDYLQLIRGVNNLQIFGNIKLQFTYEFRLLQS